MTQLQTKTLSVALPPQPPADAQTVNMEADAAAKRKLEDTDDEWTDASVTSDQKDLEEVQKAGTGDKPTGKPRIRRKEKKSQCSKSGNQAK